MESGPSSDETASKPFCGGDDDSEYLRVQRCNSDLCGTDTDVVGMANDPDKCILDEEQVSGVSGNDRPIYDEGDEVEVAGEIMACYGGRWQDEWPIQFLRDKANVTSGTQGIVAFQVVNVGEERTFNLELFFNGPQSNEMDERTVFRDTGTNEMRVTVEGQTAKTYDLEVNAEGADPMDPTEVVVYGESLDGALNGSDNSTVRILNGSTTPDNVTGQEREDVPGITLIQILWIMMTASAVFFLSQRQ